MLPEGLEVFLNACENVRVTLPASHMFCAEIFLASLGGSHRRVCSAICVHWASGRQVMWDGQGHRCPKCDSDVL